MCATRNDSMCSVTDDPSFTSKLAGGNAVASGKEVAPAAASDKDPPERYWRPVALVLAYIGTRYAGLQLHATEPSIDAAVLDAAEKSGLLPPTKKRAQLRQKREQDRRVRRRVEDADRASVAEETNASEGCSLSLAERWAAADLGPVAYGRAGRTDRGVHAIGQVVNLRLKIPDDQRSTDYGLPEDIRVLDAFRVAGSFNAHRQATSRKYRFYLPPVAFRTFTPKIFSDADPDAKTREGAPKRPSPPPREQYEVGERISEEFIAFANSSILSKFIGEHEFRNFARRVKDVPGSTRKRIYSCFAERVRVGDADWVCITLHGNAFMLNQIRKMVAVFILVARQQCPAAYIDLIFAAEPSSLDVPVSPAYPLVFDSAFFEDYNAMFADNERHVWLSESTNRKRDAFLHDRLLPHFAKLELERGEFAEFVDRLDSRTTDFVWHCENRGADSTRNVPCPFERSTD